MPCRPPAPPAGRAACRLRSAGRTGRPPCAGGPRSPASARPSPAIAPWAACAPCSPWPRASPRHAAGPWRRARSEEHTSELQSPCNLVCRLLLEKKKKIYQSRSYPPCLYIDATHEYISFTSTILPTLQYLLTTDCILLYRINSGNACDTT